MSFNSYFFVLVFFPLCTTVYFLLNKKGLYDLAKVWLICASFFFCGYTRWQFAAILALSTIANWEFYILITQKEHKGASLAFAIIANCLFLGFFKYCGYFSPSFSLVLPLGISFYTISHISFLIEARERKEERKKERKKERKLISLLFKYLRFS